MRTITGKGVERHGRCYCLKRWDFRWHYLSLYTAYCVYISLLLHHTVFRPRLLSTFLSLHIVHCLCTSLLMFRLLLSLQTFPLHSSWAIKCLRLFLRVYIARVLMYSYVLFKKTSKQCWPPVFWNNCLIAIMSLREELCHLFSICLEMFMPCIHLLFTYKLISISVLIL